MRFPFLWDMIGCHWVITAQHFKTMQYTQYEGKKVDPSSMVIMSKCLLWHWDPWRLDHYLLLRQQELWQHHINEKWKHLMHHCKHLTIQITMYCTYSTFLQIWALAVRKIYVRKKGAYLIIGNTTSACRSCGICRQSPITKPCFSNNWKYSVHALRTSLWTCKILQRNNYKPKFENLFRITKHYGSVTALQFSIQELPHSSLSTQTGYFNWDF